MKLDIIVVYEPRYPQGHEKHFVPPLTGIYLAALTPERYPVRVLHQQVQPVNFETDADLIALAFFSGFADLAYQLADEFRARGKRVVMGGPHVTFWPEEALAHSDAIVIGEAEAVWAQMLDEAAAGQLQRRYQGEPRPLVGLPTPRYDLLPDAFFVKRVVQATRGCPFSCSFCCVPAVNPGFRARPVAEVLRDVAYDDFEHWWQRKVVWFWDDNLTAQREYIKALLRKMQPLKRWWLTQASMDIAEDGELLDLMEASGCIGVFFGIETFGERSLVAAHKPQNQVERYRRAIAALHQRGICVMAGFVAGFDGDTPESIVAMADGLYDIGVDVPFLSVLTPYRGTALYEQLAREGRLLPHTTAQHYNGYNVAFAPELLRPEELLAAHRELWRRAFAPGQVTQRLARAARTLRPGALMMAMAMNGFYGLKQWRGNAPTVADFENENCPETEFGASLRREA